MLQINLDDLEASYDVLDGHFFIVEHDGCAAGDCCELGSEEFVDFFGKIGQVLSRVYFNGELGQSDSSLKKILREA